MFSPIGIIGGTALAELAALEGGEETTAETPYGSPSGPLCRGRLGGRDVLFLFRHGPGHSLPPHAINYRANIRALADAGVQTVIAAAAVGGISDRAAPGAMLLPDQIIDYTWGREHTFADGPDAPLQHIDFTEPYDASTRATLLDAAHTCAFAPVPDGVHGVTQGPRLESAAEIERLRRDGCDIVGMTGMPEAALAREAGLAYACCAVVVNWAAGRGEGAIHADIERYLADGMSALGTLLAEAIPNLP